MGKGEATSPPSHAWSGSLIADMFQDSLEEQITEAVVLALGEAILFPMGNAKDVRFSLTGPINWASRTVQVEDTANTVQESC